MPLTDANNSVVKVPEEDFTVARGKNVLNLVSAFTPC